MYLTYVSNKGQENVDNIKKILFSSLDSFPKLNYSNNVYKAAPGYTGLVTYLRILATALLFIPGGLNNLVKMILCQPAKTLKCNLECLSAFP